MAKDDEVAVPATPTKMKATVRVTFDVEFEDNGEDAHKDQALEVAKEKISHDLYMEADVEIIGIERVEPE